LSPDNVTILLEPYYIFNQLIFYYFSWPKNVLEKNVFLPTQSCVVFRI
jgi:hypothetical protein